MFLVSELSAKWKTVANKDTIEVSSSVYRARLLVLGIVLIQQS